MATISVTSLIRRKTEVDDCARLLQNLITACSRDAQVAQQIGSLLSKGNAGGVFEGKAPEQVFSCVNQHL